MDTWRRFAPLGRSLAVALGIWFLLAAIGLFRQNPLRVAKDAATRSGGWSAEQVEFQRGSFAFRGLYSVAEARLFATTAASR